MNPVRLIAAKRDGASLSAREIERFIHGFARGEIPDYQMAALAMAVYFQGMTLAETTALTQAMIGSGDSLAWPAGLPVVDKHSTGGIGDKTSLVVAPLIACCGLRVPMLSGRGLGATGGTLDKLESIPGFRTQLDEGEIRRAVETVGCAIAGATDRLVPADRRLYALRDVTGTVPSMPLMAASIMSKKLAEGLQALVLDVKWGSGAFMKTRAAAEELAALMVGIGRASGVVATALVTDMNQPLGRMAGNAVEVNEAVAVLEGGGPADLVEAVLALTAEVLVSAGAETDRSAAIRRLQKLLAGGEPREKFARMVRQQGGDLDAPRTVAPPHDVVCSQSGYVTAIDGEALGWMLIDMGAGRRVKDDPIEHAAGLEMHVRLGTRVSPGDRLATLYVADSPRRTADPRRLAEAAAAAMAVGEAPPPPLPLIAARVDGLEPKPQGAA